MQLKKLTEEVFLKILLTQLLKEPQQVIQQNDYEILQSKMQLENKMFIIRVITKKQDDTIKIITVYKTTKIKKYWREK